MLIKKSNQICFMFAAWMLLHQVIDGWIFLINYSTPLRPFHMPFINGIQLLVCHSCQLTSHFHGPQNYQKKDSGPVMSACLSMPRYSRFLIWRSVLSLPGSISGEKVDVALMFKGDVEVCLPG